MSLVPLIPSLPLLYLGDLGVLTPLAPLTSLALVIPHLSYLTSRQLYTSTMIADLLAEGRARVSEALQKGYAPAHFSHNMVLVLIEDTRRPNSASMQSKIVSTRERSARLRTLDANTFIWWAIAFPMRQWSGGRKMNSSTFDSLIRDAPSYASQAQSLLAVISADLYKLRLDHPGRSMLQDFFDSE